MKKLLPAVALFIVVICLLTACTKNGVPNAPKGEIAVTKLRVKINEPDSMLLVGVDTNKVVSWTVAPAGQNTLRTFKTAALIQFNKAGSYVINAGNSDIQAKPITITVIDSVYEPPVSYINFDASEEITVVPRYVKSATSDSSYIAYTATTKKKYCNNYSLGGGVWYDTNGGGAYYLSFDYAFLKVPITGCSASVILSQNNDYRSYQRKLLPGTYALHCEFGNGVSSGTGSIEVTDTQIIFHWDDAHNIIISPKVLTR